MLGCSKQKGFLPLSKPQNIAKDREQRMNSKNSRDDSANSPGISRREFLKLTSLTAAGLMIGYNSVQGAETTMALFNGTLIDGTGAETVPDGAVVIQGGRIMAAGPRKKIKIPPNADNINVQGGTILPGFINTHVHDAYNEWNLKAWAQGGVTTVRDFGAFGPYTPALFATRNALRAIPECARLVAVGSFVNVKGGYPIVYWGGHAVTVTSPEEATALVDAAHERGKTVTAHVTSARDLKRALEAGVDEIAHMVVDTLPENLISRMVEAATRWVPTIELWQGVSRNYPVSYGTMAINNLAKFVEAGGEVALGTNYAGAPNVNFDLGMPIHEIKWMQEAGMTPMQIIVAATRNSARSCDMERILGTLEAGKLADVIFVDGDPLAEVKALTNARLVLREGKFIKSILSD
jgi:imidazolonepropionase-like amidohydrolase